MSRCGRCDVPVFQDETGWYSQIPVADPDAPGLTFMDRAYECAGGGSHVRVRTRFDMEGEARQHRCPRCGAQPYFSCRTGAVRLTNLKHPHAERMALVGTEEE
jgi:ribosomal protein S27AE